MSPSRLRCPRLARVSIAGLMALFVGAAAQPAHASDAQPVSASALVGPCTPPTATSPPKLRELLHSCKGTAVLSGTWTGTLRYYAEGTVGVVSGDSHGRVVNATMPVTGGPEIADFEGTWRPRG